MNPSFGQIGSIERPVVVISTGSKYDRFKKHQSILVAEYAVDPSEYMSAVELQWDPNNPRLGRGDTFCSSILPDRTIEGDAYSAELGKRHVYKIKINKDVVVEQGKDSQVEVRSASDITIGSKLVLMVTPEPWKSKDRYGYVFRCTKRLLHLGQGDRVVHAPMEVDPAQDLQMKEHVWQ